MSSIEKARIVLVCTDCENTRILYHGISDSIPVAHIVTEGLVSKKLLIKRRIKKMGLFKVASQLVFQAGVVPLLRRLSRNRIKQILQERNLSTAPLPPEKVTHVPSVNDPAFTKIIKELAPDLIIVNGTRIIAAATLAEIQCPIINVHVGITPLYRGVHGAYWALVNNDKTNCGVTVHAIDKGIDTGAILAQGTIEVGKADNFITYPYLQFEKAIQLVKKVVPAVLNRTATYLPKPGGASRLWYHPSIWQYIRNRLKGIK
jgi:methionyl-tRNA formyltransferase